MDIVSSIKRSEMMAGIRNKNTRPEMQVRKGLHALGFRYRIHAKDLPGKPDIVLPKYKTVIFVHGCFWHGHNCHLFKMPQTKTAFWSEKISKNRLNDDLAIARLQQLGWSIILVWECSLKGREKLDLETFLNLLTLQIRSPKSIQEIYGIKKADY